MLPWILPTSSEKLAFAKAFWIIAMAIRTGARKVVDGSTHRAPEEDVARWRDREPDRRRIGRSQQKRGDRQGASPRSRAAALAGEAGRREGKEGGARNLGRQGYAEERRA